MATPTSAKTTREMEEAIDFSLLPVGVTACVIRTIVYELRLISVTIQIIIHG